MKETANPMRIICERPFRRTYMSDNEKFADAARKYMDTVYRVAYSWLRNPDDANDVTQNTFLKLYSADKEFESESHLKNWLIRVAINECKSVFRSPWSKNEDIDDYAESLQFEKEDYRFLFDAVMSLDKKYRVPLMLFYYEGYKTAEISSILGIPEKTVSTRIFRAKAKLKEYLKED